ncbi:type II secretion system protein K [Steroidobacter agaridevorans]|uniref:Type II secretion system protein K n=1 Tax=Steroidobacter agaridevorans TaxID=2695856 RepID=A0A829YKV6_9GAMM|nr:type II secretion system minor pseudopilin GspK [Steroidobacter agaridevorans]GFE83471.1 type II secretion system protein K [Steroidobacter agaridevorans]GFE86647.1 type II secretion system protein K [Steroidobacter agaridevorans]
MKSSRHQRGVALVMAVLIVALATILAAEVGFRGYLDQRRTVNTFSLDQSFEIAMGGEAWASDALRRDKMQSNKTDDFTEEWAVPIPPIPLEDIGGEFEGQLEDLQGRFNLNDLVTFDQSGQSVVNKPMVELFERLLTLLEIEPKWAGYIADWIDSDNNAGFPDGAEDPVYTNLSPPYRTANMPITRASELLALPEFGAERYRKIAPFVTALPARQPINLCTASPELLDAMIGGNREFTLGRDVGRQTRQQRCFPTPQEFEASLSADRKDELKDMYGETSDYFLATIWVTLGTQRFTLYSLLYRSGGANQVRPILRSYGTL